MSKKTKKILAGAAGLLALQNGLSMSPAALAADSSNAGDSAPASCEAAADDLKILEAQTDKYTQIAHVEGSFRYDQTILSPSDKVFSLFGTAATAACAAPGFSFDTMSEEDCAEYYINVGGKLSKSFELTMNDMKQNGVTDTMKCSCAMSPSIVNAQITGVPLSDVIRMADLEEDVKSVILKSSDGYGVSLSLEQARKSGALLVYDIGGEGLKPENGGPVQLWMPSAAANYFARQITEIEFSDNEDVTVLNAPDAGQRAKVNFLNAFEDRSFPTGSQITFEGYADDYDVTVAAVEFSLDGGQTWTSYETPDATTKQWVYWYFTYDAAKEGTYRLDVRCRTADGKVSPLASSIEFTVADSE